MPPSPPQTCSSSRTSVKKYHTSSSKQKWTRLSRNSSSDTCESSIRIASMCRDYCTFGTREDWLPGLVAVERDLDVQFVEHGIWDSPQIHCLDLLSQWEYLGISQSGNQNLDKRFWIISGAAKIEIVEIPQRK